jgi:hypothetical protein
MPQASEYRKPAGPPENAPDRRVWTAEEDADETRYRAQIIASAGLDPRWVWPALHEVLLAELCAAGKLDLGHCPADASQVRALKVGTTPGRPGSKHHLITDAHGIPLTGGPRPDVIQLIPLVEAIPPIRGRRGRPARAPPAAVRRPRCDHDKNRRQLRPLGITPAHRLPRPRAARSVA